MMSSGWPAPDSPAAEGNPVGREAATTAPTKMTTSSTIAMTIDDDRILAA